MQKQSQAWKSLCRRVKIAHRITAVSISSKVGNRQLMLWNDAGSWQPPALCCPATKNNYERKMKRENWAINLEIYCRHEVEIPYRYFEPFSAVQSGSFLELRSRIEAKEAAAAALRGQLLDVSFSRENWSISSSNILSSVLPLAPWVLRRGRWGLWGRAVGFFNTCTEVHRDTWTIWPCFRIKPFLRVHF